MRSAIGGAALVLSLLGCGIQSLWTDEPPLVETAESEVIGAWCGRDGERFQLNADHTFTIEQLSEKYGSYLAGPAMVEEEFGGVRPTTMSGSWLWRPSAGGSSAKVAARFERFGAAGSQIPSSNVEDGLGVKHTTEEFLLISWFGDADGGYDYFSPAARSSW